MGFSIFGAFSGAIAAMIYLGRGTKALRRILDISALAFFPYIFFYFFSKPINNENIIIKFIIFTVFILLFVLFITLHKNFSLKDSSIFFAVTIIYAHLNLLYNIFNFHRIIVFYFCFSDIISAFLVIISIALLIKNERKFFIKT